MPQYRSKLAQDAHNEILLYIKQATTQDKLKLTINQLDTNSLLEKSINGQSHLIDIMHLPYAMTPDDNPNEKCIFMMEVLLDRAFDLGSHAFAQILIQADNLSSAVLHHSSPVASSWSNVFYNN